MSWKLTGKRYFISGGAWLDSYYFGYAKPEGIKNLEFSCDSDQYWADEVEYNGETSYFFLCDDTYRFFM